MSSASDIAAGDDAIYRVAGRRIMFSAITIDILAVVYTLLAATYYFNIIRLTVYHPAMMNPWWTWTPYWRVFGPGVLMFLPTFLYLLVFYRRAALMGLYLAMSVIFITFCAVCWVWLIIDWKNCKDQLWCACITDYTITGGMITMTYCTDADNINGASNPFVVNFSVLTVQIVLAGVMAAVATYIHFQYYYRNDAYNANNPYRTIAYAGNIGSEMESGRVADYAEDAQRRSSSKQSRSSKASNSQPHLYAVAAANGYKTL